MGRNKVVNKNKNISISLVNSQIDFIKEHSKFDLSKFVQLHLQEYIALSKELEYIRRCYDEKTIK